VWVLPSSIRGSLADIEIFFLTLPFLINPDLANVVGRNVAQREQTIALGAGEKDLKDGAGHFAEIGEIAIAVMAAIEITLRKGLHATQLEGIDQVRGLHRIATRKGQSF
jgi:hypothetical protein